MDLPYRKRLAQLAGRVRAHVPQEARTFYRDLESAWHRARRERVLGPGPRPLPGPYFIRGDYREREEPAYDDQALIGTNWQQSVYDRARELARELDARQIVDIGCGDGRKLAALHPEFTVVGVDYLGNLAACRERYPFGTWLEHDLESELPLPLEAEVLSRSVIVCADVIEHLVRPERLLRKLRDTLSEAAAILISTPDRELNWGFEHRGPPPNTSHVREWSWDEFAALLVAHGLGTGTLEVVPSNEVSPERKTLMAVVLPGN